MNNAELEDKTLHQRLQDSFSFYYRTDLLALLSARHRHPLMTCGAPRDLSSDCSHIPPGAGHPQAQHEPSLLAGTQLYISSNLSDIYE